MHSIITFPRADDHKSTSERRHFSLEKLAKRTARGGQRERRKKDRQTEAKKRRGTETSVWRASLSLSLSLGDAGN